MNVFNMTWEQIRNTPGALQVLITALILYCVAIYLILNGEYTGGLVALCLIELRLGRG